MKILHLLIQYDVDLNRGDASGDTPAHIASIFGRVKILRLLIKYGANINARNISSGETPLFLARQLGQGDVVELLLEYNAEEVGGGISEATVHILKVLYICTFHTTNAI